MSQRVEDVSKDLEETLAFAKGDTAAPKVHVISVEDVDLSKVRQQTGLS